jgi:ABC-type phosphate/phosphonate transport system substrate-binding protein
MPIAGLAMYDLPELRDATDVLWQGLARGFRRAGIADVPPALERGRPYRETWQRPDLLFAQTCGYPLTHALAGRVRLVATPCYRAEACEGPSYCSIVIVRADHPATDLAGLRGARCVTNSPDSQSGYSALRALVSPLAENGRFFANVTMSGSHLASIAAVAAGKADIAAIDCVTHALVARHRPRALEGTRILTRTAAAPGLPYITRGDADDDLVQRLRDGLVEIFADPHLADAREALLLRDAVVLPLEAYGRITDLERQAAAQGYADLA